MSSKYVSLLLSGRFGCTDVILNVVIGKYERIKETSNCSADSFSITVIVDSASMFHAQPTQMQERWKTFLKH